MKPRYIAPLLLSGLVATAASAQQYAPPPPDGNAPGNAPYCREFTQQIVIAGTKHTSYGTSCMQPDGTWKIVAQQPDSPPSPNNPPPTVQPGYAYAPPAYVVAGPPVYYGDPYYGYPYGYVGPAVSFGVDFGHGWYHDGWHGGGWRH